MSQMVALLKKFYCCVCKMPTFEHESKDSFSRLEGLIVFHMVSQGLLTKRVSSEHAMNRIRQRDETVLVPGTASEASH